MITRMKISTAVLMAMLVTSCRDSNFSGGSAAKGPEPTPVTSAAPKPQPTMVTAEKVKEAGPTIDILDNSNSIKPDYSACSALPSSGKVKYPAQCADNQVMAVINDGETQEMTCCPVNGTNVFSAVPTERFQQRTGQCQPDEVGVGMVSAQSSTIYCSRINTQYLKLSPPQNAVYVSKNSNLAPEQVQIARSYNQSDTCICPLKMILIGGHSTEDNECRDQCVEILLK